MFFNSLSYFLFLPIVFAIYWSVGGKNVKIQNTLILCSSFFFYGLWSQKFLFLLILIILLDFFYGIMVQKYEGKRAKLFLWLSVINNLGILGVFKYYNFFIDQFQTLINQFGFHVSAPLLKWALPIGISFYTFHGMSYVFDIYRKKIKATYNLIDYAVFVSFFPLLVAGPIERASHLLPQIKAQRIFKYSQAVDGCKLILWGLFKKVIIADGLAPYADYGFTNYTELNAIQIICSVLAFSFQIYGDFSGYTDMALGSAKLLGFELLSNFKFPYFSRDIAEFWRRWHISLSSWFRDYIYIPLGGSKAGKIKAVRNVFIIFLISGFWHGASWNFIFWGFVHACAFVPILVLNKNRDNLNSVVAAHRVFPSLKELLLMISTFAWVSFAWIFFRANGLQDALKMIFYLLRDLLNKPLQFFAFYPEYQILVYILPLIIMDWSIRRNERELTIPIRWKPLRIILYLLIAQLCFGKLLLQEQTQGVQSFIYFQF